MRFVSGLFGLLILVNDAVQVVHSQNLSRRGRVIRMREGSRREPIVAEINQKMNSHQRQRQIKGEKEEKNEDEGAKKKGKGKADDEEVPPKDVIEGDDDDEEKDEKLPKGEKGQAKDEKLPKGGKGQAKEEKEDTKGAKKEKAKEKKEEMKESDKIAKGTSTIPPMTEDSAAPADAPSNTITSKPSTAAEETTSPAPTISPTCVECDDLGR